jgi:hypothetical protein
MPSIVRPIWWHAGTVDMNGVWLCFRDHNRPLCTFALCEAVMDIPGSTKAFFIPGKGRVVSLARRCIIPEPLPVTPLFYPQLL